LILMSADYLSRLLRRKLVKHLWGGESDKRVIQKSEKWTLLLTVARAAAAERWFLLSNDSGTTGDKVIVT
jgi:hypothetical protein